MLSTIFFRRSVEGEKLKEVCWDTSQELHVGSLNSQSITSKSKPNDDNSVIYIYSEKDFDKFV
jgi:hypothetical protein